MNEKGCLYWCTIGWVIWLFKFLFYNFPKWIIRKSEEVISKNGKEVDAITHKKVSAIVILGYILVWVILIAVSPNSNDKSPETNLQDTRSISNEQVSIETALKLTESLSTHSPTIAQTTPPPTHTPTEPIITETPTPYVKKYYITDTGSKYHEFGCSSLNDSSHEILLDEAIANGYGPCGRCNP